MHLSVGLRVCCSGSFLCVESKCVCSLWHVRSECLARNDLMSPTPLPKLDESSACAAPHPAADDRQVANRGLVGHIHGPILGGSVPHRAACTPPASLPALAQAHTVARGGGGCKPSRRTPPPKRLGGGPGGRVHPAGSKGGGHAATRAVVGRAAPPPPFARHHRARAVGSAGRGRDGPRRRRLTAPRAASRGDVLHATCRHDRAAVAPRAGCLEAARRRRRGRLPRRSNQAQLSKKIQRALTFPLHCCFVPS